MNTTPQTPPEAGQESDTATIRAVLACEDLVFDSYERADAGIRHTMADLFTEGGSQGVGDQTVTGREAIREMLAARDAIPGRKTLHVVTNLRIRLVDPDRAHAHYALTLYLVSGPPAEANLPQALSSVDDELIRVDGRWLLQSRQIQLLTGGN